MSWKCPECGLNNAQDAPRICGGCGKADLGALTLEVEATGKKVRMSVDTDVGRELLKTAAGEDARFASTPQFRLCRDEVRGAWVLRPRPEAVNPTLLDGREVLEEGAPLAGGQILAVGSRKNPGVQKLRLIVRFEG